MRFPTLAKILRLSHPTRCLILFGVLLALSVASQVMSIATTETRWLLIVTAVVGVITIVIYLPATIRRHPRAAATVLVAISVSLAAVGIHFHRGNRRVNPDVLRNDYVRRIHSFDHALYIWGGESHFGIDCSGLARISLVEALVKRGLVDGNVRLVRCGWVLWMRDMTAKCMLEHKYEYFGSIGHAERLSLPSTLAMNPSEDLRQGDLAVSDNGAHVLVYTGDGRWTEANPDDGRVVTNPASGSDRTYFNVPVTILRWWVLEDHLQLTH